MNDKIKGLLMACIGGMAWGTYGIFSALLTRNGMESETVSMLASFSLFLLFLMLTPITEGWKGFAVPRNAIGYLILDAIFSAAFIYTSVKAYTLLSAGIVSTIIFANLFLLMIACRFIFKDPINTIKIFATIIAVFGVMLVVDVFHSNTSDINTMGLIYTFVAMLSWTMLVIFEKIVMGRGVTPDASCCYEGLAGVIFMLIYCSPVGIVQNFCEAWAANGIALLIPFIGFTLVSVMASYYFYMHALKKIEATYVQICYTLDPALSCILGFFLLNQILIPSQIAGIILVVGTVIVLQVVEIRADKRSQANSSPS